MLNYRSLGTDIHSGFADDKNGLLFDENELEFTQKQGATQRETGQFLSYIFISAPFNFRYAKDIMRSAGSEIVHLFDLLQGSSATKRIASQAFYHVLSLANAGEINVMQDQPYGDIKIQICEYMK